MRRNGEVSSAGGLLPFGHLGWGYRGQAEILERAAEYLADGLAQGQWVELVGEGGTAALRDRLASLPGGEQALAQGRASVCPVEDFYVFAGGGVVDPEASVVRRAGATYRALGRGFAGFRTIVDATAVTRTAEAREAFARFERLMDARMSVLPVGALCAYDLDELGPVADELICLHPLSGPGAGFRLFSLDGGASLGLGGELDLSTRAVLHRTLARLLSEPAPALRLDLTAVRYVERAVLLDLDDLAAERGRPVTLTSCQPVVGRLVDVLGLEHLSVAG
jgi:anti-anti-sigma regulatory factor